MKKNIKLENGLSETFVSFGLLRIIVFILVISCLGHGVLGSENVIDTQLTLQLHKDRISSLSQSGDNKKTDELKQLINQIRSIQLEPSYGELDVSQQPVQQPTETASAIVPKLSIIPAIKTAVQSEAPVDSMSTKTLQMVEDLLKDPNTISNPFELAEVLFQSGRHRLAGLCYKQALTTIDKEPNMPSERAWILFQIGNCFNLDDPNTAKQNYAELIRTHPDSLWAEAAKARYGLVDWYQQDQPRKLIQKLNE